MDMPYFDNAVRGIYAQVTGNPHRLVTCKVDHAEETGVIAEAAARYPGAQIHLG